MTNHKEGLVHQDDSTKQQQVPPLGLKPSVGMTNHKEARVAQDYSIKIDPE